MKDASATELRRQQALPGPAAGRGGWARLRESAAGFALSLMFLMAQRAPWLARLLRTPLVRMTVRCSRFIRTSTLANGRRIVGVHLQARRFARGVVGSFYDFVCDVGQSLRMSKAQMVARVERIDGHEKFVTAREPKRGAILLTAHMGSFEAGVAALLQYEPKIHVVFKRDTGRFEQIRQELRRKLGVVEQPVDDGWDVWMRLRDALRADEVVAIQGDRVMPGQKGRRMAMLGGHMLLPTGPVKLAMASGAPIVPVFSVRTESGGIRLFIEDAIVVEGDVDEAMTRVAAVIEKYVAQYPEQWLVLHKAFEEDTTDAATGGSKEERA